MPNGLDRKHRDYQVDRMKAVSLVLKQRFPHLTTLQTLDLAQEIVNALDDVKEPE